ncbi:DUF350 domain-containing protein [Thalassolituus sp. LLYu03]|uniref:DUF350 domain-containing protein n=1 Tax=Thalassolituus sp. LLYu03 TaxID=3421656 RepID=UPI003D2E2702
MPQLLDGLLNFAAYFSIALATLLIFKVVYTRITPQDEWRLIRDERNLAAAIGFAGAIIGFSIALYGVITHSVSLQDFSIWALVALIAQLLAFAIVRFLLMPDLVRRIGDQELSAGVMLGAVSIACGVLNAACMSW